MHFKVGFEKAHLSLIAEWENFPSVRTFVTKFIWTGQADKTRKNSKVKRKAKL